KILYFLIDFHYLKVSVFTLLFLELNICSEYLFYFTEGLLAKNIYIFLHLIQANEQVYMKYYSFYEYSCIVDLQDDFYEVYSNLFDHSFYGYFLNKNIFLITYFH